MAAQLDTATKDGCNQSLVFLSI